MASKEKASPGGIINQFKEAIRQNRKSFLIVLIYNIATLLVFLLFWVIAAKFGEDIAVFTRDPAATAGFHPLYGAISYFGILLLGAAATLCFFISSVYKDHLFKGSHRYLFASGLLMLGLLLDDLFMLHEEIFPYYLHIEQNYVYGFYILIALGYFIYFSKSILKTEFIVLLMALFYIALSVLLDYMEDKANVGEQVDVLVEDGLKLLGFVTWFIYFLRLSVAIARSEKKEV